MAPSLKRMDLRKTNVLLVDDNAHSLELLGQLLRGFRVERISACRSADEAREAASTRTFDLIIIDGEMPGEDGISLTRHIRREFKLPNATTPIIVTSAHTPLGKVARARDAGANMIVRKPIAPATLLSRIQWLALEGRDFVRSDDYCGPDRRLKNRPLPAGVEERRADALALTSSLDRTMSQNDINSLFD